jgi:hypothetical protein
MDQLGKTFRALLDIIGQEKSSGMKELHAIMQASHLLFYFEQNKKIYLTD